MSFRFEQEITQALNQAPTAPQAQLVGSEADLPSVYDVAGLCTASIAAAAAELAALTGGEQAQVDRRLAQLWFGFTLRPDGWQLPSAWDPIAGDYRAADGWIRLHTNAPHHRAAALSVLTGLGQAPQRDEVQEEVSLWPAEALQEAVVAAGGCASAMLTPEAWAAHPQGQAVAAEPLIAWDRMGEAKPVALDGLKVLDLTRVLAGPVGTRFLAGFGAKVLRIDPPSWEEPGVEPEVTLGKICAGLDLKQLGDRARFTELLKQADVLVHGYRPEALELLGFGAKARWALNPGLIDVALCAWGWSGPWSGRRGFDSLVQMSSGIAARGMALSGAQKPVPLPVQALDHATGYLMAAAVLHALRSRAQSGQALSARVSLARTAALLASAPVPQGRAVMPGLTDEDYAPEPELTAWGRAQRLRFPVKGLPGPVWTGPATRFRSSPASW